MKWEWIMATMYYAKINVNKEIYDVYSEKTTVQKILDKLYLSDWQKEKLVVASKRRDETGKKINETIKFISIDKKPDENMLVGRMAKIFQDELALYNEDLDDIQELPTKSLTRSIPFFFDVNNEIVAFIAKQQFSKEQFVNYFEELINKLYGDEMFKVFLKQNMGDFENKLTFLSSIRSVEVILIPPNTSKSDFDELFADNAEEIEETQSTKFEQKYSAPHNKDGLIIKAKLFQRIIKGIAKGYGIMKVRGTTSEGKGRQVNSDTNAPFKTTVDNRHVDSLVEVENYGRMGIALMINSHNR